MSEYVDEGCAISEHSTVQQEKKVRTGRVAVRAKVEIRSVRSIRYYNTMFMVGMN